MFFQLLLLLFAAAAAAVSEEAFPTFNLTRFISVTPMGENLLWAKIRHKGKYHEFSLVRDANMFVPHTPTLTSQGDVEWQTTRAFISINTTNSNWAFCTIDPRKQEFTGVFSVEDEAFYVTTARASCGGFVQYIRPMTFAEALAFQSVQQLSQEETCKTAGESCLANMPPHSFKISIAVDYGFAQKVHRTRGKGAPLAEKDRISNVMFEIEHLLGLVRVLMLKQFNIQVQVERVLIGGKDSEYLNQAPSLPGTCKDNAQEALEQFNAWKVGNAPDSGLWLLLTDCHIKTSAGYYNGAGTEHENVAIVPYAHSLAWLRFAQEFANAFGAKRHFFVSEDETEKKNITTLEFQPVSREAVCAKATTLLGTEVFAAAAPEMEICGNLVLEPGEECECLERGNKDCLGCKQCRKTNTLVACTKPGDKYVVRHAKTPQHVAVEASLLSHADCCNAQGELLMPRACNKFQDVCSSTGHCERACSKYGMRACGFDDTGCVQMCGFEGKCQGAELKTKGPPPIPVGSVPDGNMCKLANGGESGVCSSGTCVQVNATSTREATGDVYTIDAQDLPSTWTKSQAEEKRCPVLFDLITVCLEQGNQGDCEKLSCAWCANKQQCHATARACELKTQQEIDEWYAPCEPKL